MISSKKICALLLLSSCISNVSCDRTPEWKEMVDKLQHQIGQEKSQQELEDQKNKDAENKTREAIANGTLKHCGHQSCIKTTAKQHVAALGKNRAFLKPATISDSGATAKPQLAQYQKRSKPQPKL